MSGSQYSKAALTDENFDEEYGKLIDMMGRLNSDEYDEYDELPNGFAMRDSLDNNGVNRGFVEWHKEASFTPQDCGGGVHQVLVSGEIAFEFGNKFLSLHYNDAV